MITSSRIRRAMTRLSPVVVVLVLLGAIAGGWYANSRPVTASAQTRMLFAVDGGNSATDLNQASTYLERQMTSFVQIATSDRVLVPAGRRLTPALSADDLAGRVTVTNPTDTVILDIAATGDDERQAIARADAVAAEVSRTVAQLSPSMQNGAKTIQAGVIQPGRATPSSGAVPLWLGVLAGALVGLIAGCLVLWLWWRSDSRLYSPTDVASHGDTPVLATLASGSTSGEDAVEQMRRVRAAAVRSSTAEPTLVVVTTVHAEDGRVGESSARALADAAGGAGYVVDARDATTWTADGGQPFSAPDLPRDREDARSVLASRWPEATMIVLFTDSTAVSARAETLASRADLVVLTTRLPVPRGRLDKSVEVLRSSAGAGRVGIVTA